VPRSSANQRQLNLLPERKADFIEPMDCAPVPKLIDGPGWVYEIKLGGYRALAIKYGDSIDLFSRRRESFIAQYPYIVEALRDLPEGTVVDGEIVALDDAGRPNFNLLSQFRSRESSICYFIFDVLICQDRDLTRLPLSDRREFMKSASLNSSRCQRPICWPLCANSNWKA